MSLSPSVVDEKAAKAQRAGAERDKPIRSPLYWIGVEKKFGHGGPYIDITELVDGGGQE